MILESIQIFCPDCKKDFDGVIAISMNSHFAERLGPDNELFARNRTCPHCNHSFDIYNDGNGKRRFRKSPLTLKAKIKKFFEQFMP